MRSWSLLLLGLSAFLFADPSARAFQVFTVGPAADCPYHSIQTAVDAAAATRTGLRRFRIFGEHLSKSGRRALGSRLNRHLHRGFLWSCS